MAIKLTVNSFLKVLRQSRLLPEEEVDGLIANCETEGVKTSDAAEVAKWLIKKGKLTLWQGDKLLQGKHKGYHISKYLLKDLIGRGGMSTVFLAKHKGLGTDVAIKVLPQKKVHDSSYLQRFKREARAAASVDHPNIVRAFDIDMERDGKHEIHFIVMEYVDGRDLTEIVEKDGVLEPARAAEIARQAADALAHAHSMRIVHRDMKPGNLMVEHDGLVRLLDLGLARIFEDEQESLTIAFDERVLGTADYLAPEQAFDSHTVDGRADIYGLGCTMYYMLTGHPPFNEGTLPQRLIAHQTKQPPPIRDERPDVTDSLLSIINKMMEKDPDKRYQSAEETSRALGEWLNRTGTAKTIVRSDSDAGLSPFGTTDGLSSDPDDQSADGRTVLFGESSVLKTATDIENQPTATQHFGQTETTILPQDSNLSRRRPKKTVAKRATVKPNKPKTPTSSVQKDSPNRWAWLKSPWLVLGLVAALLAGTAWLPDMISPQMPATLTVGPDKDFKTINAAIDHVENYFEENKVDRRVQVIKVDGGKVYKERIVFDNSGLNRNYGLHIFCEDTSPAILTADGPQPLLQVVRAHNFQMSGFTLENPEARTVVELSEHSPGTKLSHLTINDFSGQAILARELSGTDSSSGYVVLSDIKLRTSAPEAVGFAIQSRDQFGIRTVLQVNRTQFVGPMNAGIIVDGSARGLEVHECVFSKCATGIRFAGSSPDLNEIQIGNNTFHKIDSGIVFVDEPSAESSSIVIARNLFAEVNRDEVVIRDGADLAKFEEFAYPGFRYNWTSGTVNLNELDIFAHYGRSGISDFKFGSTNPSATDFLQPTTHELPLTVGHPTEGLKAWVGAIPPLGL